jgi:hypothetical protein
MHSIARARGCAQYADVMSLTEVEAHRDRTRADAA